MIKHSPKHQDLSNILWRLFHLELWKLNGNISICGQNGFCGWWGDGWMGTMVAAATATKQNAKCQMTHKTMIMSTVWCLLALCRWSSVHFKFIGNKSRNEMSMAVATAVSCEYWICLAVGVSLTDDSLARNQFIDCRFIAFRFDVLVAPGQQYLSFHFIEISVSSAAATACLPTENNKWHSAMLFLLWFSGTPLLSFVLSPSCSLFVMRRWLLLIAVSDDVFA